MAPSQSHSSPGTLDSFRHRSTHELLLSKEKKESKTYSTGDSLVVTDPATNPALRSLTRGERTGSRVFS
ncbi:hypothetical protein MYCTH_2053528 [Thermothelomyces thermophilus ATCC 42464]|uniref:Uncharacterized protein n=1 Tax=Thermothelomyces thermophilus (strain ATCC 42464 / BCRC 31852 / DSM 1799) TaxID=573729 RepID=G2Q137_THET4|nr:uncharacterized protein MYCTH_2053528 [Thermothelomyces thermophilus ATCC 42464]AEO54936.1 hypothetical protein MYCTH_2053528 [Thermothelomyces thermophilus ATCC 42464]